MNIKPNRWLRLKHSDGFDQVLFDKFVDHCHLFQLYVEALINSTTNLPNIENVNYIFFDPELSQDKKIASLPIGGERNIGSRSIIENELSWMLWRYMPVDFKNNLEETRGWWV